MITNIFKTKFIRKTHSSRKRRYELLVSDYGNDLYRYAYWLCKNQHDAEDLVQETYLRAWRFIDDLADDKVAKSWLITILRRENARRFRVKPVEYIDIEECYLFTEDSGSDDNEILREKILGLNDKYREPLLLQVLMGFTAEEVAEILSLKLNTVLTRLARAKKQLRDEHVETNGVRCEA
ncbi:sigma-70 family RNA polymerase sigma factor [Photobacterium makurazakiensis]|uniref:sigma-70 family RNA polymerase sigma factor n=1 Tax=Photobacterium makurazakiensis TaxID=2910234 RepID=UPI003D0DB423